MGALMTLKPLDFLQLSEDMRVIVLRDDLAGKPGYVYVADYTIVTLPNEEGDYGVIDHDVEESQDGPLLRSADLNITLLSFEELFGDDELPYYLATPEHYTQLKLAGVIIDEEYVGKHEAEAPVSA